jgi:hypothetical protein
MWPRDHPVPDEIQRGHAVDAHREKILEAVHLMDVGKAHDPERREHEDADAGAEISAV